MVFLLQLFGVVEGRALFVFQCENEGSRCRPWRAFAGANAVMVCPLAAVRVASGEREGGHPEQLLVEAAGTVTGAAVVVGGSPEWVQGEGTPRCCGEAMELVAQLRGDGFGLEFGDAGVGYVFRCRGCRTAAFLRQSA
jgi:hypothetical protein